MHILSIIRREIGKLKTHSPIYCILDNWENMLNLILLTHLTKYIWQAFYKFMSTTFQSVLWNASFVAKSTNWWPGADNFEQSSLNHPPKWPPFRRRWFRMHFHEWKFCILIKISLKYTTECFEAQRKHSYLTFWFVGNGLAPTTTKYCHFNAFLMHSVGGEKWGSVIF